MTAHSNKRRNAIVVFSGGQDSTTCLFWALEHFNDVTAVTFNYGQRHIDEISCAEEIAKDLRINHRVINLHELNELSPNALTRREMIVSKSENGLPSTFVEGRNLLFISYAAILGRQLDANHIVTGVCETDFSGYPDCKDIFIKSLNVTLNLSMDNQFVIHTPLMWLNKAETWKLAEQLGRLEYVKDKTLTCYEGIKGEGCGQCPSCELRKKGYEDFMMKKGDFI
ncbi:7-cyano-7-deazaguanine synthase QueC [Bacillus chungangensis]|uniref:7-cyano-7-deazaguanine synthase n=1 Tax=Bacillus chungangensis TaxID=587633 RepID=A0ABT9WQF7_9BACI|nr:7-cyano-7-deazaguanine synthase QueC [Bacillus chungangensis]MDQ0175513.1 7-cyano-7-deazaguanine synthase [Bacillus chungangensis]